MIICCRAQELAFETPLMRHWQSGTAMEDWKKRARLAQSKLEKAGHGDREAVLQDVANGLDVNTVRRWVTAVGFLDRLAEQAPDVWQLLQDASYSELEVLARWTEFDVSGALEAARDVARGLYSARRLTAAMHKARQAHGGSSRNESFEDSYRKGIEPLARKSIGALLQYRLGPASILDKDSAEPPVDFRYLTEGQDKRVKYIAAIICGPYKVEGTYFKRRFEWVARAFALAWHFDVVVILVPDDKVLHDYETAVLNMRRRAESAAAREVDGVKSSMHRVPIVYALYPGPGPKKPARPPRSP
jgi:hypothetical protein